MARIVGQCFFWAFLSGLLGTMSGCGGAIQVPLSDLEGVTDSGESPSGREEPSPNCASNADCDDGLFCNGTEFCDAEVGECRSSGDPCRSTYLISGRTYDSGTDNITAEIQAEYGPGATLAEWNDIKAEYGGSVSSIQQFMDEIGMSDYRDDGSGGVYWVTYNAGEFWTAERHYHATRQNGNSYGWFLYHDDIQGHQMALGPWWGTYPALVKLPGASSEAGTCNEATDTCEASVPPCVAAGEACDEEHLCCEDFPCRGGVCALLASCTEDADCEDDDLCTIDSCIEGECASAAILCDDRDACTVDECEGGDCVHTARTCNDDDPCTLDDCVGGECVFTTMECDDGDACTIDECVAGECVFTSIQCGNPPIAKARVIGTPKNEAISITLLATDPEGDSLIYSVVDAPAHGTLAGDPPAVTYTPNEDYVGFDLFSFQADDGRSGVLSNTANVRIWVIDEDDLSGNTVTGHLLPGGTDVWSFQGVVGQRVAIKVSYGYPRARLSLYPPGGGALETTTRDGWIDWPLQNTGQYTVAVEDPWSVSVGYNLSVLVLGAQLASLSDLDGGPITAGETLVGQLAPTGDIDVYTFEGVEGQRVLITISYGYPSARLALYPPGGGELEAWSSNLKIDRMLQTSGLYSIVVVRDVSVTIGYNLTLQRF